MKITKLSHSMLEFNGLEECQNNTHPFKSTLDGCDLKMISRNGIEWISSAAQMTTFVFAAKETRDDDTFWFVGVVSLGGRL